MSSLVETINGDPPKADDDNNISMLTKSEEIGQDTTIIGDLTNVENDPDLVDDREDSPVVKKKINYITRFLKPNQNYLVTMFQYSKKRKAYSRIKANAKMESKSFEYFEQQRALAMSRCNFVYSSNQNLFNEYSSYQTQSQLLLSQDHSRIRFNESTTLSRKQVGEHENSSLMLNQKIKTKTTLSSNISQSISLGESDVENTTQNALTATNTTTNTTNAAIDENIYNKSNKSKAEKSHKKVSLVSLKNMFLLIINIFTSSIHYLK